MSICLTNGIKVTARPFYLPDHSDPQNNKWVFGYEITIANEGIAAAQLVSRHWVITDGRGHIEEVEGPGVIGQQPVIEPGESFTYQSFCPLPTNYGFMRGAYEMIRPDGERFEAQIATFVLMPTWMLN